MLSIIGLTATPTPQTIGFFNGNLVQEYTHEKAVADGVNVGYDVYRIETQITKDGATLVNEPGVFVPRRDRRTKEVKFKELDDDLTYTANQLDRDVVAENQIRLVISTFRDKLFTDIFPGRTEVPKTLVFAKDDSHAEDITQDHPRGVREGERLLPEDHLQDDRQEARNAAGRVSQLLQSSHCRHGGHDFHWH